MADQLTLGIDIGGTRTRAAMVSAQGEILARRESPTAARGAPEVIVATVAALVSDLLRGIDRARILAAGVCAPGPLDAPRGIALATPTIAGFRDFPLRDRIAAAIGLPTLLDHDGQAAAFGEWQFGAGRGRANMVYVTISTGIGGGAVVDGRLQRGHMGMAAHVGHMTIQPDGPICNCGNPGCWEALASGPAFATAARTAGFADGAAVFAAMRTGDPGATGLVAQQSRWLAIGLVNLMHIYSPEIIVLGGGVVAGIDLMRPFIAAEVARRAMAPFRNVTIARAELLDNAGVIGAAALGRQAFLAGATPD